MTETILSATSRATTVEALIPVVPPSCELWLFGSSLTKEDPQDIDLLLVYDDDEIDPRRAYDVCGRVAMAITAKTRLPVDVVVLNAREAEQTAFAQRENAVQLRPSLRRF